MPSGRFIIRPEDGEQLLNLGSLVNIKLPATETAGAFAVIEHCVPPGGGPPPHTHRETELLYILSGKFGASVGEERSEVEAGTLLYVPAQTVHTTRNIGAHAGRQLSVYLPGGGEGFFRDAGTPVSSLARLPDLDQPPNLAGMDFSRILELAARYGMRVHPEAETVLPGGV